MAKLTVRSDEEREQQALRASLWAQLQRFSRDLIYSVLMRSGGEPFGAPFEMGLPTLTERVAKRLKQRGFFTFESLERLKRRRERNKYTRHGAAPFRGPYPNMPKVADSRGLVQRLITYLRDNRFFLFASVQPKPLRPPPDGPAKRRPTRS